MVYTLSLKHSIGGFGPPRNEPNIPRGVLVAIDDKEDDWIMIVEGNLEFERWVSNSHDNFEVIKSFGKSYPRRTMPKGTIATFTQDVLP